MMPSNSPVCWARYTKPFRVWGKIGVSISKVPILDEPGQVGLRIRQAQSGPARSS